MDGHLLDAVEGLRLAIAPVLDPARQAQLGQYFTPASVARLMAGLFPGRTAAALHLLDAGAGIGMLSAAWVEAVCGWAARGVARPVGSVPRAKGVAAPGWCMWARQRPPPAVRAIGGGPGPRVPSQPPQRRPEQHAGQPRPQHHDDHNQDQY